MILAVLAATAATHTAPLDPQMVIPPSSPPARSERMPNLYSQPARCGPMAEEITRRIRTATGPKPLKVYAVNRMVDGCAIPAPMGYSPDYLLPGAVDQPPPKAPPR